MADDAFALSPISARATQPREEDYEAISGAFMETTRGRWFLSEYAKRNRNADTSMVLDAVARIEANLATARGPASDAALMEALATIAGVVDDARASALAALDGLALEETLAPVRKGARVIREIAWRLREIGADGRICDLIDSQVAVIEAGCGQLASADPTPEIGASFDLIEARIGKIDDGVEEAIPSPGAHEEVSAAAPDTAEDDAVLDRIAFEMAAIDPSDVDEPIDIDEPPAPAPPETIALTPEPVAAPAQPPAIERSLPPSHQPSLGSALIANGIVRRPQTSASDPLAPIRRMTQAEKIAFFS